LFPDRLLEQLSIRLHHPARQRTTVIARKAMKSPRFARDDDNPAKADFQVSGGSPLARSSVDPISKRSRGLAAPRPRR
jgi:hypothetical protein